MAFRSIAFLLIACKFSAVFSINEGCGQIKRDKNLLFPWNVGIYLENQHQLELICFGSIIHSKAVLTAAHCFCDVGGNIRNSSFYIATDNLKKSVDTKSIPSSFYKINRNNIVVHKYYKGLTDSFTNDVAIVKTKFHFDNKITPICIDWSDSIANDNDGKQPFWDKIKVGTADQSLLDFQDCSYSAPENFEAFVREDKSCTEVKNSNVHLGRESEGAGLIFLNPGDKRWYIEGVISMHEPSEGKLSTYTTVKQYLNWISNIYASL